MRVIVEFDDVIAMKMHIGVVVEFDDVIAMKMHIGVVEFDDVIAMKIHVGVVVVDLLHQMRKFSFFFFNGFFPSRKLNQILYFESVI